MASWQDGPARNWPNANDFSALRSCLRMLVAIVPADTLRIDHLDQEKLFHSTLPPSAAQKRLVLVVVLVLATAFFITAGPLSSVRLPKLEAFVLVYATAMFLNTTVTAVLLVGQFLILQSGALMAIACGYLFAALMITPWMLTFPGILPAELFGVVLQAPTSALDYLYCRGQFSQREETRPAVMLLDLKLPKINGLEVLQEVRSDPQLRVLPVVVLTSSHEEKDLVRSYGLGVNAYVVKPVDFHAYVNAVKELGVFWAVINEPPPGTIRRR